MGYHRVNVPLRGGAANPAAGDAVIDLTQPEMLLYEKTSTGAIQLVGVGMFEPYNPAITC